MKFQIRKSGTLRLRHWFAWYPFTWGDTCYWMRRVWRLDRWETCYSLGPKWDTIGLWEEKPTQEQLTKAQS